MNTILIQTCPLCGKPSEIEVDAEKYTAWRQGREEGKSAATHGIQVIFSDRSDADRETILSGTHSDCWDGLFGKEDEEQPHHPDCPANDGFGCHCDGVTLDKGHPGDVAPDPHPFPRYAVAHTTDEFGADRYSVEDKLTGDWIGEAFDSRDGAQADADYRNRVESTPKPRPGQEASS